MLALSGRIVWAACRPILKILVEMGIGFAVARCGMLNAEGSKIIATILVWVLYPCLLFQKVVSGLDANDLSAFGIMTVASAAIVGLGFLAGILILRVTNPPVGIRYATIMATALGNSGDLPLAIVLSLGDSAPFSTGGSTTGAAYISAYLCFFNIFNFTVGYLFFGEDAKAVRAAAAAAAATALQSSAETDTPDDDDDDDGEGDEEAAKPEDDAADDATAASPPEARKIRDSPADHVSFIVVVDSLPAAPSDASGAGSSHPAPRRRRRLLNAPPQPTPTHPDSSKPSSPPQTTTTTASTTTVISESSPALARRRWWRLRPQTVFILRSVANLGNISTIVGLVVAAVPVLKALFVAPEDSTTEAPLSFLFEVFAFVGAAAVPTSLLNLGASLARLGSGGKSGSSSRGSGRRWGASRQRQDGHPDALDGQASAGTRKSDASARAATTRTVSSDTVSSDPDAPTPSSAPPAPLSSAPSPPRTPWSAVALIAVTRLLILPAAGIAAVAALAARGVLPSDNKMLLFVAMLEATVPTASFTVFFTQMWDPNGDARFISTVVLVQYVLAMVTMTVALAIILSLLS